MNYTVDEVITDVRRALDEVTLEGVAVRDTTDFVDYASSNFSDDDLEERIADAGRYIAARVQSRYLSSYITETSEEDISKTEYAFNDGIPPNPIKVLRMLGSRVYKESPNDNKEKKASRWSFVMRRKHLSRKGMEPSDEYPYYVFEDNNLIIEASTALPAGKASVVTVPETPQDTMQLPPQFRSAVIQYVVWSCFRTLMEVEQANLAQQRLYKTIGPYLLTRTDLRQQDG